MSEHTRPGRQEIAAYDDGRSVVAHSPVTLDELHEIEQTIGWSGMDTETLRRHEAIFVRSAERMVDKWRSVVGSQPHLAKCFFGPDGMRDDEHRAKVKPRFVQWEVDLAQWPHDQARLNYQEEIGLRHLLAKKSKADERSSLLPPRSFHSASCLHSSLSSPSQRGNSFLKEESAARSWSGLKNAWIKAVHLYVTLWTRPYTQEGLW